MFDLTGAHKRGFSAEMREIQGRGIDAPSSTGVIFWEEHCVECGQPYCFKICKLFERSFDGKCRRFRNGIARVRAGYACEFKKWGKLEGVFTGRLWSARGHGIFLLLDGPLSCLSQIINRLMSFVPGRIGAITIYRRLRKYVLDYLPGNRNCCVNCALMNVWADQPVKLHFSIIEHELNVFDALVELKQGWNVWHSTFSPVGKGARFLLFSTEKNEFSLIFSQLDIVCHASEVKKAPFSESAKKHAQFVKCVAWDLDNTLWRGILVEDGLEKLVLNTEVVALIKKLDQRGVVHTILSKNDYESAMVALRKFGLDEYFVFPHINWLPKSGNLEAVAKEINIGLDAFAFIDDSPFERGEVAERLPMVRVFNVTKIGEMSARPEFNPPMSAESSSRRISYRKEMLRKDAANEFNGDYDEFLRSCKITLTLFDLRSTSEVNHQRCYELIQRTNQLTLAGRRYSEDEFKALIGDKSVCAYGIRCEDRFGDYGIVGVVIFSCAGKRAVINEFVMSCRVAKKKCEEAVINWVAKKVLLNGAQTLETVVVKTNRNMALVLAFDSIETMQSHVINNEVHYKINLCAYNEVSKILKVIEV